MSWQLQLDDHSRLMLLELWTLQVMVTGLSLGPGWLSEASSVGDFHPVDHQQLKASRLSSELSHLCENLHSFSENESTQIYLIIYIRILRLIESNVGETFGVT